MKNTNATTATKLVKLTDKVHVRVGKIIHVDQHPSGRSCDGAAIIVDAFRTSLGANMIRFISLNDRRRRVCVRRAERFAEKL